VITHLEPDILEFEVKWPIGSITMNKTAATAAKSLQSCPTLCDPIDSSPPGSPVPGILQERPLEWVAISFSNAESEEELKSLLIKVKEESEKVGLKLSIQKTKRFYIKKKKKKKN